MRGCRHDLEREVRDDGARDALAQVQLERLQATLNRALRNVAFYRESFARAGVQGRRGARASRTSARLPFTTKDDLRTSYPYDMFAVPLRDIVRIQSTSGTTGTPVVVGYTRNDLRTWSECVARLLAAGGHDASTTWCRSPSPTASSAAGFGFHDGAERIGASVIPASTGRPGEADPDHEGLQDHGPGLHAQLRPGHRRDRGGDGRVARASSPCEPGFFGAEPWSEGLRGAAGVQPGHHRAGQLRPHRDPRPGGVLRVRAQGRAARQRGPLHRGDRRSRHAATSCPPGSEGELVLTTITKEGFPLVRYRTGDLCSLTAEPCACGRTFARMSRIRGRIDDMIIMGAVKVFPSQIEQVILEVKGLQPHYEIVVDRAAGIDTLEVRVEISEDMPELDEMKKLEQVRSRIAQGLAALLDIPAKVTLVEPRTIAAFGGRQGAARG